MPVVDVETGARDIARLIALLDEPAATRIREAELRGRRELAGRTTLHVNSTARGGGVAEMLYPLIAYARGIGVDVRWAVIGGDTEFFRVTKRIHNWLHGQPGDGGYLGEVERMVYERALAGCRDELLARLGHAGIAVLHDPQTAGLIPGLADAGVPVIWRCHVGVDQPNEYARAAWAFLARYVEQADRVVFSRRQYAWDVVEPAKRVIIAPSIDPFAPKNQELTPATAAAILAAAGLRDGEAGDDALFERLDGATGRVTARADVDEDQPLTAADRFVLQVSRWDGLKDPIGVIDGFAEHVAPATDAHLVYAGPDVAAVTDDPEGAQMLAAAREHRAALPSGVRERVHLAMLPMADLEENAAIVNALQRCASVVVQKSLAEGFGLTVAEAMWKERPVVASRVGGIADQIEDGVSGVLVGDPRDLAAYGAAVRALLLDPARARRIGAAARDRVAERFLGTHSLIDYLELIEPLLDPERQAA
ncbi:MAG: trehalose synthase [Thermoleophilales bacterium]|nr:trehalose synthase [Thermoleophilales bacterium]